MDLASIETRKNIAWDESIENILSEIGDESQINAFMHKKSQAYYTTQNIKYQLPIIVLSALSGTGNFISANFPAYASIIVLAVGGVSIFTSIISSVAQFLKVSQLSESHRMSYLAWEKFHSTIKFQLNKRRIARDNIKDFVSLIIPEYQRLKEISADIPTHILESIKNNLSQKDYSIIINILFNKNLRSWFVESKINDNKILFQSYYFKILWRNLNVLNKIFIIIIKYFPLFILKRIIFIKREKIQKNFNFKIKFLLIGIINTGVNYFFSVATYYLFYKDFGFILYNILNIFFGITFSFNMFKFFLFKTDNNLYFKEYIRSYVVYSLKISIGFFLLFIFLELLKINIFVSQALTIILTTLLTYKGHKKYTFKL
jgi:putative flippase GtrA